MHFSSGHHVRYGEPASRFEDAERLAQNLVLVGGEVDHAVGDDDIHRVVGQRDALDLTLEELDVGDAGLPLILVGEGEHFVGHIQTVGFTARRNAAGGQENI